MIRKQVGGGRAKIEMKEMQDFARQMRWLVDEAYPDVPVTRVVVRFSKRPRLDSKKSGFPRSCLQACPESACARVWKASRTE